MNTGELRHRITIQSSTDTRDAAGGPVQEWSDDQEIWAKVSPASGREITIASAQHADLTHKILIRKQDGVDPKKRIVFGTRRFKITSVVDHDERGIKQMISAIEVLDGED